jgi:hypothetical protein
MAAFVEADKIESKNWRQRYGGSAAEYESTFPRTIPSALSVPVAGPFLSLGAIALPSQIIGAVD